MEQHDISVAHLIEYADHMTFAEGSTLGRLHGRDIRDVTVVANGIAIDEVSDFLYQAVVAYRDITEGSVVDA